MAYLTSIVVLDTGQVLVLQPISGTFSAGGGFATSLGVTELSLTSFGGSVFPSVDALFSLGSLVKRWSDGYFSGTVSSGNIFAASVVSAGTYQNLPGVGGSGTIDIIPKWTTSSTLGNSVFAQFATPPSTTVSVGGHIVPSASVGDNNFNLGSLSLPWAALFVEETGAPSGLNGLIAIGDLVLDSSTDIVRPVNDNVFDLGKATKRFRRGLFGTSVVSSTISAGGGFQTNAGITLTANAIQFVAAGSMNFTPGAGFNFSLGSGNFISDGDAEGGNQDIGISTKKWRDAYFGRSIFAGGVTVFNDNGGLFPNQNDYSDIGSVSTRWRHGYFSGTISAGTVSAGTYINLPPGGGYDTIQDEGTPLTQRTTIDFTGAGVTASDSGSKTTVNIPGGAGSVNIKQTDFNFGIVPTFASTGTIVDSDVGLTSQISVTQAFDAPVGKMADENEMDSFLFVASAGSGSFVLRAESLQGRVVGAFRINYLIG